MARLLESGDVRLLESGDARLLEGEGGVVPPTPSAGSTIFDDSKGFPSEEYENAIDRITFMMQELEGSLCDCRYIDPVTGLPPVVECVALLSTTGIFNTDGGEATPIAGETLTLGVGVSGTGPYTYQWKVDAVDVVGATSLTFEYVVTSANVNITVQVTNECSTILVGPYEVIVSDTCYNCEGLWQAGQEGDAYWPMTDPMVPAGETTQYFHAGANYGPYTDGAPGLMLFWNDVGNPVHPVIVQNTATIAFADFNYCDSDTVTYTHWMDENLSGLERLEVRLNGATLRADHDYVGTVTHTLVGAVSFIDFAFEAKFTFVFDPPSDARENDTTQAWTTVTMDANNLTVQLNRGAGTSPSETVAHDFDITKPYVLTTFLSNVWTPGDNPTRTANSTTTASQPGATTISISLSNLQTYGEQDVIAIINGTGTSFISLGQAGNPSLLGITYKGTHEAMAEGLARNYEDYECP